MNTAAVEDKRAVALREAKIRDLQIKITALQTIENVRVLFQLSNTDTNFDLYWIYRT